MNKVYLNKLTVVILIITAGLINACSGSKAENAANSNANAAPAIVNVTTAQAIVQDIPTYFEATGTLASDAQTDVAPTVAGKITQVNFDLGSYVQRGSVLVRLDDRDSQIKLNQANDQVQQAQSNVNQVRSQVEQARANVRQVQSQLGLQDGGTFEINQVAEVKTAKAALELAEKELTRSERLLETGDIAKTIYDQRKSQRDQAAAQYQAALNGANQRFAAIRVAQSQVDAAQAAVKTAQLAADAAATQVQAAKKAIADTNILAPISGYVAERVADVGEFAATNTKIATIVRTSVLRLKIDVPEQSIGKVGAGQSVSIQTSAYPDRNFAGTVARISPGINTTSRVLTVEADVDNPNGLLKPGQFATVRITQPKPESAVMIPATAVKSDNDINKVFIVKDGVAQERQVLVGLLENDLIEIKQGIQEGETVATDNLDKLKDGVIVKQ